MNVLSEWVVGKGVTMLMTLAMMILVMVVFMTVRRMWRRMPSFGHTIGR